MVNAPPITKPISDQNVENLYPFSDQNSSKTIPFRAVHTYIPDIGDYPPGFLLLNVTWSK